MAGKNQKTIDQFLKRVNHLNTNVKNLEPVLTKLTQSSEKEREALSYRINQVASMLAQFLSLQSQLKNDAQILKSMLEKNEFGAVDKDVIFAWMIASNALLMKLNNGIQDEQMIVLEITKDDQVCLLKLINQLPDLLKGSQSSSITANTSTTIPTAIEPVSMPSVMSSSNKAHTPKGTQMPKSIKRR
jgi:hypothetical protein